MATDIWNFFSKNNSFNKVMSDIVFKKKIIIKKLLS